MNTRHADYCRCADCIDGENRLVPPAAIASAAPSSLTVRMPSDGDYARWAAKAGALVNDKEDSRVVFSNHAEWGRFCDLVRTSTPAQAPAIPRVDDFVDGAIPDIQDEGGTLVYYSRSAVHECIESVVYALANRAQAPAIQAPAIDPACRMAPNCESVGCSKCKPCHSCGGTGIDGDVDARGVSIDAECCTCKGTGQAPAIQTPEAVALTRERALEMGWHPRDLHIAIQAPEAVTLGNVDANDGFWRSCSGCHELNEGHSTGPYSEVFKCALGVGCRECGGLGAVWDDTDYNAMAEFQARSLATPSAAVSAAARDVLTERQRQISAEGWTPDHDDEHTDGSLSIAAACYALVDVNRTRPGALSPYFLWKFTGWASSWWKPKDRRSNLVRSGALILAEIERLDRTTPAPAPTQPQQGTGSGS